MEDTMDEKIEKAITTAKARLPALTAHSDMQKAGQAILNLMVTKATYAGFTKPTDELDEEIGFVLGKVRSNLGATDLQQVTQAAMHLMQAKAQIEELQPQQGTKITKKQGAGAS